jgi:hypothetical protein
MQAAPVPVMTSQQMRQGRQAIREIVTSIQLGKIVERLKAKK